MSNGENPLTGQTPSGSSLWKSAFLTLSGAIVVTVLFIMPAEFGVDPTGVGTRLGLTSLADAGDAAAAEGIPATDPAPRLVAGAFPGIPAEFDYYEPEVMVEPFSRSHDAAFRSEKRTIALAEFEQVEVKAVMRQGDSLVYSWKMTKGDTVYSDFHADTGDNPAYPEGYWVRYLETEEDHAAGSIVAPFDGHHGWYWLNIEEGPVEIELEVHGYYESIDEIMRSFQ